MTGVLFAFELLASDRSGVGGCDDDSDYSFLQMCDDTGHMRKREPGNAQLQRAS